MKLSRHLNLALGAAFAGALLLSTAVQAQDFPVGSAARVDDSALSASNLGRSVAIEGDVLISGHSGSFFGGGTFGGASVFRRTGSDWVFEFGASVGGTDSGNGGISVAIDGDRIVVGAPWFGDDVDEDVSVWEWQGSSWTFIGSLEHHLISGFGRAVDISGDTVIVGVSANQQIKIYHYEGGNTWTNQLETWIPSPVNGNLTALTSFGRAVAIEGDVAIAGAWQHPTEQLVIFKRTGSNWTVDQTLNIADMGNLQAQGFTNIGSRVALDANVILVTAAGAGTSRVICVLEDTGSGYQFHHAFGALDGVPAEQFGSTISLDGDMAVIAAPQAATGGAAYSFLRDSQTGIFEQQTKFVPTALLSRFGSAVAISDGRVAIGAELDTGVPQTRGTVYVIEPETQASMVQALCAGNGNQGPTCANCPCGNNASTDSVGGCLNSAGTSAILSMLGESRASADSMRLEVTRAQPSSLVLLFSGSNILPINPGASGCVRASGVTSIALDGLRCITGGVVRHGTRMTNAAGNAGDTNDGWGGPFAPAGGLISQGGFAMGQNRYFQAIYRDAPAQGCGTGLNTSNAIAAIVLP